MSLIIHKKYIDKEEGETFKSQKQVKQDQW